MGTPPRLVPFLDQFDFACGRLIQRLTGPSVDSGDGNEVPVEPLTDAEYLWEPVAGSWSIRRRSAGPGPGATVLAGRGEWGRDGGRPHPVPPPVTTIAWRLGHLSEMLVARADHVHGTHTKSEDDYEHVGDAAAGIAAFERGAAAWRSAVDSADDAALDTVGYSTYPAGSDPEVPFIEIVWWMNQEVLHHGAEIALLRDLYRRMR
ncbi:DinB family protein [Kibdelosporangium phytohabitans]|uniref:DinB-like domain-containing protein n=1 Tax=Kibdelosporangium phytohabitans TaxID=860235 RepID=A0A0N7F4T0_9PSEU|nr:DinB family protein [Kibdelosporangium phytohabitans]ALG12287.1 hypothetical protein AOZ06_40375 [Kibdelosporangium phytohabitans]MBE1463842.1 hypothetical protein [Kibdelosporangium phytohabitans]